MMQIYVTTFNVATLFVNLFYKSSPVLLQYPHNQSIIFFNSRKYFCIFAAEIFTFSLIHAKERY